MGHLELRLGVARRRTARTRGRARSTVSTCAPPSRTVLTGCAPAGSPRRSGAWRGVGLPTMSLTLKVFPLLHLFEIVLAEAGVYAVRVHVHLDEEQRPVHAR